MHPDLQASLSIDPDQFSPITSHSRIASFRYALAGCLHMLRFQKNIRIQAVASVAVCALGLWLRIGAESWAILVLAITFNLMSEFTNAAIEAVVNLASPGLHPMARVAKDVAAGTSLVTACGSVLVGLLVLGPPLWTVVATLLTR
jgi:diacylglycerol kinase